MSEKKVFNGVVELNVENHIATILLNNPENGNKCEPTMTGGLYEALTDADFDDDVRVIVLRSGAPDIFLGQGDLENVIKPIMMKSHRSARQRMFVNHRVQRAMTYGSKPIIAAIDGAAIGGGCGITLSSDIVFCTERSTFNEIIFNISCMPPDSGGLWQLQRLVGPMKAKYIAMNKNVLTAKEAYEYGMCVKVLPDAEALYKEVYEYAALIASRSPVGIFATKQISNRIPELNYETYLLLEAEYIANGINSEDFKELLSAMEGKRPPQFKGY